MIHSKGIINVGVAAYGLSGSVFHAPLINAHAGFSLHTVCERTRKGEAKKKYPDTRMVTDFEALITDRDIDLIVINTPEHTHFELGKRALLAGKHVIIEKPFTVTSDEAKLLAELAQTVEKKLSIFQNCRWHGDFITMQKIINGKLLGKLVEYEAHYDRFRNTVQPDSWKEEPHPGSGSLYNLGSHMIDQALVLFGLPQAVWADLNIQRPGGKVHDQFELLLYYPDLKVSLKSSYLVREQGPRYLLHGTKGSFIKYGTDPQEATLNAGISPLDQDFGREETKFWGKLNTELENGLHMVGHVETLKGTYMGFYDNIYEAIKNDSELEVKPDQAIHTIEIIEAAIQSALKKGIIQMQ